MIDLAGEIRAVCSTSPEDPHPETLSRRNRALRFVDYTKSAVGQLPPEPRRLDQRKVALERLHRRKFTGTNHLLHFTRQLQDCGKRSAGVHQSYGILQAAADSGVFEDQRCVDQLHRIKFNPLFS